MVQIWRYEIQFKVKALQKQSKVRQVTSRKYAENNTVWFDEKKDWSFNT